MLTYPPLHMKAAIMNVRSKENERFYGKAAKAKGILWDNEVVAPAGKGIEELHQKLELLKEGKVMVPTPASLEKKASLRSLADEAGVSAKASQTDVIQVDAKEEAAKEASGAKM